MSSEPSKSKKAKRFDESTKLSERPEIPPLNLLFEPRLYGRAPRLKLTFNDDHLCPEKDALDAARLALKSWNEKSNLNKGVTYELLEVTGAKRMAVPYVLHCNFIARPCRGSEAEHKLFFAEMRHSREYRDEETGRCAVGCTVCCILGLSGTKTGLIGCEVCGIGPGVVHHPENGEFIKCWEDYSDKVRSDRDFAISRECPPETISDECALVALSSWNAKSLSQQGPEYKLDKAAGCNKITGPTIYHCNFIARPIDASEDENTLFFAELRYSKEFSKDGEEEAALGCLLCCNLGSLCPTTGHLGCSICKSDFKRTRRVHHPLNEDFIKGRRDAMSKSIAKKKQSEIR